MTILAAEYFGLESKTCRTPSSFLKAEAVHMAPLKSRDNEDSRTFLNFTIRSSLCKINK